MRAEPVRPARGRLLGTVVAVGGLLLVGGALVLGPTVLRTSVAPARLEAVVLGVGALLVLLHAAEPLRWSRRPGMPTTSWPAGAEEYAVLSTAAQAAYLERDWLLECARLAPMTGGPVVDRLVADGWLRAGHGSVERRESCGCSPRAAPAPAGARPAGQRGWVVALVTST